MVLQQCTAHNFLKLNSVQDLSTLYTNIFGFTKNEQISITKLFFRLIFTNMDTKFITLHLYVFGYKSYKSRHIKVHNAHQAHNAHT